MIKITNGLATMTLAAGLVLGAAGSAAAAVDTDNDMTGVPAGPDTTELTTPIANMTVGELAELKGQEIYNLDGGKVGRIVRLVRDADNHAFYYVVKPYEFSRDEHDRAAIPVNKLRWQDGNIVVAIHYPNVPLTGGTGGLRLRQFVYTGDTWAPKAA